MDFIWESIQTDRDATEWMEFAFFSANFQHVMQLYGHPLQLQYFDQTVEFAQQQTRADLSTGLAAACSPMLSQALEDNAVIVTFHFGFYRTIPVSLLRMGYRVALLVSREVFESQQAFYAQVLQPEWFARLLFVLAENPKLFFRVRQLREQGYQVLCYADGGAGVKQGQMGAEKRTQVRLGEAYLPARSGFADMAYLLQVPLCLLMPPAVPPVTDWVLQELEIHSPKEYPSRQAYVEKVMHSAYGHLGNAIRQTPHAWECWFYLHRTMQPRSFMEGWPIAERFIPLLHGQQGFVLDKGLYRVYRLKESKLKKIAELILQH
ncbi:hypothetical protein [Sphingobacterium gobiense]|uniref:Lipid A biosynthesis acyltransferase n=1 Tax=Sphingobacterium gobiense TaxID=1382456 RepID=A0A2S9JGC2_9SPHI|nr:hypothetical protein [Sphingobacterium gobiense]PRD51993.1 hypothetical protein C5749_16990 [Sphingobacterium gobiense]